MPGLPVEPIPGPLSYQPPKAAARVAPWQWAMLVIIALLAILIVTAESYTEAFLEVVPQGIVLTLRVTAISFALSGVLGLATGLARVSKNKWSSQISQFYIEFVRGVPVLVWIFFIALAIIPGSLKAAGLKTSLAGPEVKAVVALSLFYAAFLAEVFRAGVQSVSSGQIEAGKSIGLTDRQVMRRVILPQAIRNVFPAFANDVIALFKDTALVSILAVGDMTYEASIYAGSSFRFFEAFFILMVIYVILTFVLSSGLGWIERRIAIPGR